MKEILTQSIIRMIYNENTSINILAKFVPAAAVRQIE